MRVAVWSVFGLVVLVLSGAGAWFGRRVLELEETRHRSRVEDRVDGLVNRAMWRMEYAAGALVLQEAARHYQQYAAMHDGTTLAPVPPVDAPGCREALPSPLLNRFVPYTKLHFQVGSTLR